MVTCLLALGSIFSKSQNFDETLSHKDICVCVFIDDVFFFTIFCSKKKFFKIMV